MAQTGRRVAVVDADLRRPMLQHVFQCSSEKGLTTLLLNREMPADECLQATAHANLRVLTSGPLPPNPAELLGSAAMDSVLNRLLRSNDLVMFDSSPVQAVADPTILAAKVDAVVLIADARNTRPGVLKRAVETLARANPRILGVALNKIDTRSRGDYYYYQHYYSNGDGHSPGQNGKASTTVGIANANGHLSGQQHRSTGTSGVFQVMDGVRDLIGRRNGSH